jgi:hypothetical protein
MKGALAQASNLRLSPVLLAMVKRKKPDPCPEPSNSERTDEKLRIMAARNAGVPHTIEGLGPRRQL